MVRRPFSELGACPRRSGFTLIELLIVVAIIAILAAIAVPNFLEAQTRSKVSRTKADMRSLATAVLAFQTDTNKLLADGWDLDPPPTGIVEWQQWFTKYTHFAPPPGNQRMDGDPMYFIPLTTPISYISSTFIDPFTKGRAEYTTGLKQEFSYLYTRGPKLQNYSPGYPQAFYKMGDTQFLLQSIGPDHIGWIPSQQYLQRGLPYDPTNGTVSKGDITYISCVGFF